MNNFDISSTGVNIEINCFYDADRARSEYDENFVSIQREGSYHKRIEAYTLEGNVDVSRLNKGYDVTDNAKDLFRHFVNFQFDQHISLMGFTEVKDIINDLDRYVDLKPLAKCTTEKMLEAIRDYLGDINTLNEFLEKHYNPTFVTITARGHCQGDWAEVIFYKEVLDQIRSNLPQCEKMTDEEIAEDFRDTINNLMWDQQVYCLAIIDGEEYQLDEYLDNTYNYDVDQMIKGFEKTFKHEKKEYVLTWLKSNLPDTPRHN